MLSSTKHLSALRRVMLVSPVGALGGGEEVLLALIRWLPAFGYAADLVCLRPGALAAAARDAGSPFVAEGRPHRMRDIVQVRATKRWLSGLIAERRPAIVHCNHTAHLYGRGPAKRGGAKDVWHIHDYPHRIDWVDRLCRLFPTDGLIFTTPFVQQGYPLLRRRFTNRVIAPAAPDLPLAAPGDVRARLRLPRDARLFLTATRLQAHKGHEVLLDAAALVLKQFPTAAFVITGEPGDDRQVAYLEELKRRASALGVYQRVYFIGWVSDADLAALYGEAAALIHPARTEGFGLALVNAMRGGLAVIAADAEGPRYVLDEGRLGRLVPRGDAAALAHMITEIMRHPPPCEELARIAAESLDRFSAERMAKEIAALYDVLSRS